jgi:16S rRNA (adenine1518-N6/adenine1519-N6)-dimethyltransferase
MSALAVTTQALANVRVLRRVPPEAFYPRPKVNSAVLVLEPRRAIPHGEIEAFRRLVHAGFKQPRKTLANSLSEGLAIPREQAIARLAEANLEPNRRPQELSLEEWVRFYTVNA